jgi:hypothetical protein
LFYPSKRGYLRGDQPLIETNQSVLKTFRNPKCATKVLRIEIGSQTEFGCICEPYRFVFGFKLEYRGDRTKYLVMREVHGIIVIRNDRGFKEATAFDMLFASDDHSTTFHARVADKLFNFSYGGVIN